MPSVRLDYIDIAKGIGMFLVVYGHINSCYGFDVLPGMLYISTFHVPLFFFISGMFFKRYDCFNLFVKKKIHMLLVPFIFFYLTLSYILPGIQYYCGSNTFATWNFDLLWKSMFEEHLYEAPLWFLVCLLLSSFALYLITALIQKRICLVSFAMISGLVGYLLSVYKIQIPLFVDSTFLAFMYFTMGFMSRDFIVMVSNCNVRGWLLFISIMLLVPVALLAGVTNYFSNSIETNFMNVLICSFCGIFSILLLSMFIRGSMILTYIGMNSLLIMCTHMSIMRWLQHLVRPIPNIELQAVLLLLLTMCSYILITPVFNKYLPFIVGKSRNHNGFDNKNDSFLIM